MGSTINSGQSFQNLNQKKLESTHSHQARPIEKTQAGLANMNQQLSELKQNQTPIDNLRVATNASAKIDAVHHFIDAKPPTKAELKWARELESQVTQGYQANPKEVAKYEDIYQRLQASQPPIENSKPSLKDKLSPVKPTPTPKEVPSPNANVSKQEMNWAIQLEEKVKQGYQPNAKEIDKYTDIAQRLQGPTSVDAKHNPQPLPDYFKPIPNPMWDKK